MKERILVVVNPKSGKLNKGDLCAYLRSELSEVYSPEIITTSYKGEGNEIIQRYYDDFDLFAIFGGDGSINETARALLYKDKPLGIIPGGSGNGLARGLKIPPHIPTAVEILKKKRVKVIDAGQINDDYFFNIAGIGLDAWIAKDFNEKPLGRGIPPYVLYAFTNYIKMPPFLAEVFLDGQKRQIVPGALLITFSNFKEWGGNTYIAPHAQPDDGLLDFCLIERLSFPSIVLNLPKLFTKRIDKVKYYTTHQIGEVVVQTPEPQIYHYDGEKGKWASTIKVKAHPLSLRVIVPESF